MLATAMLLLQLPAASALDVPLPPVGPASWRARLVLGNMTQAEKLLMVHGAGGFVAGVSYVGHVPAIGRLGIPAINLEDGPQVGVLLLSVCLRLYLRLRLRLRRHLCTCLCLCLCLCLRLSACACAYACACACGLRLRLCEFSGCG